MQPIGIAFEFEKSDATGSFVRGWASVVSKNGEPIIDAQGDLIDIEDLRKAAHAFVGNARAAKAMHSGAPIGEIVESVIIDDDVARALGVSDGRRGWWIGMQVNDAEVRKRVVSGELRSFSIGGRGKRIAVGATA